MQEAAKTHASTNRYVPIVDGSEWVWVPDNALHLEDLWDGTSPLYAAVSTNQHEAVELLLQAGANPLLACRPRADQHADTSTSRKKKKKAAAQVEDTPRWTTPLHQAVRQGDMRMLSILLDSSQHLLHGRKEPEFRQVTVTPTAGDPGNKLMRELAVTVLDSEGQTPLSLALGSKNAEFAGSASIQLLLAGMQLLQPVKDLQDVTGESTTHALLLAAKVGKHGA
jgi:ankyrin repeat protein